MTRIRSCHPLALAVVPAIVLLFACDRPAAFGEVNSLILVGDEATWTEVEAETYEQLERTVFTTREENTFNVTYVAPGGGELDELLLWKQVLVFGLQGDPLVEAVADEAGSSPEPGAVIQAEDVWARGQLVTAVVLEPGSEAEAWRAALPGLAAMLDRQFREYALRRMFASGVDSALADALGDRFGVSLRAPQIYHGGIGEDGIVRLRNANPRPSERIRSILIQRVASDSASGIEPSIEPEAIYAWRESVDGVMYNVPQGFEPAPVPPETLDLGGAAGTEVRGIWQDEGTFPAAGPFLARAVRCPDAVWYFDAWLYSPNPRASKYEFLMQLEEILDSFRCTTS